MYPDRFPTSTRHDFADTIEAMVLQHGKTLLTDPDQLKPGQYLRSSTGYYYINHVSRRTGRVGLERCRMNRDCTLSRTGRYVAKNAAHLTASYGWEHYVPVVPENDWQTALVWRLVIGVGLGLCVWVGYVVVSMVVR